MQRNRELLLHISAYLLANGYKGTFQQLSMEADVTAADVSEIFKQHAGHGRQVTSHIPCLCIMVCDAGGSNEPCRPAESPGGV